VARCNARRVLFYLQSMQQQCAQLSDAKAAVNVVTICSDTDPAMHLQLALCRRVAAAVSEGGAGSVVAAYSRAIRVQIFTHACPKSRAEAARWPAQMTSECVDLQRSL
jgi:hypothetical protein